MRYGRTGGIAYRHIADNYIALFSHSISCGVHEATYILDGLLKNTTVVQPKQIYADTHGQSTTVFALAYLLGIELFLRIRNWRQLTLFCGENSSGLRSSHLYGGTVYWELIEAHWEDYWHVVLAIRNGMKSSAWILAQLNSHGKNSKLYLAFQELGRVIRTVYLQDWIRNDTPRRQVTAGTNKVETFHEFAAHLRFGGDGLLKTNDPAEQEKATVFNQLIANAVMVQTMGIKSTCSAIWTKRVRASTERISPISALMCRVTLKGLESSRSSMSGNLHLTETCSGNSYPQLWQVIT